MIEHAFTHLVRGWSVFPCRDKHTPLVKWKRLQKEPPTPEEVKTWWQENPDAWIGVALGEASGIVRVDADSEQAYDELLKLGGMPPTLSFRTPSGGRGWLLKHIDGVTTNVLWKGRGEHEELRLQSDGAYTILPPSPGYEWVDDLPIADIPRWLYQWCVEKAVKSLEREFMATARNPDKDLTLEALDNLSPERADDYTSWIRVGMALQAGGHDYLEHWIMWSRQSSKFKEGECEELWEKFNCNGGLTSKSILWWAKQDGWVSPRSLHEPLTEGGNAEILSRLGRGRIVYSPKLGWLAWDSRRWITAGEAVCKVQEVQKEVIATRRRAAFDSLSRLYKGNTQSADFKDKEQRKRKTVGRINSLDNHKSYVGTRELAKSTEGIICDWRDFNRHPMELNFLNGTLNLETGELREHRPGDLLTNLIPHNYIEGAPRDEIQAFLSRSLPNREVREYLIRKLGSTLLGESRKELLILWGPDGDNGKTKLIELMLHALDDYAVKCSRELLIKRKVGDDDRNTVMLYGKRFAAASETEEDGRLNESLIKELTGGDTLTTRYLFHEKFSFVPVHDIVYVTNHKPSVGGSDDALWNRIKLIEFDQSFPPGHPARVEDLWRRLTSQVEGFLSLLVDGCREYLASGRKLDEPGAVRVSTSAYRKENNHVARFLEFAKWRKAPSMEEQYRIAKKVVTDKFKNWLLSNPMQTKYSGQWFGKMMRQLEVQSEENYYFLESVDGG